MRYWLVKTEPEEFSYSDLERDRTVEWTGVRNYQARNFMKDMQPDDLVLFYHSGRERAVVGLSKVEKRFYQDPTSSSDKWVAVDLIPVRHFTTPVTLDDFRNNDILSSSYLVRQSRLSVMPLEEKQFRFVLKLGGVEL